MFCKTHHKTIENIIKISHSFDDVYVINDYHNKNDSEFKYLPPHCDSFGSARLYSYEKQLKQPFTYLSKNTLSPFYNEHVVKSILKSGTKVCVVGFLASIDIIATCLDLIQRGVEVLTDFSAINDSDEKNLELAKNYLTLIGVKQHI